MANISPRTFLAALPLFKSLDRASVERLAAATTRRTVKRGERVFSKGEVLTGMYVLVYGEVRLLASGKRSKRLTGVVRPGRSFGEPMMFLERPAVIDAEAASDALVLYLPKETVFDEIERNPVFARRVIAGLSERIEALVNDAERRGMGSGRDRLIQYVVRNARQENGGAVLQLPGPKAFVASHLHITPEHFSRLLHELAADGLIEIRARRITVPDLQRLVSCDSVAAGAKRRRAGAT